MTRHFRRAACALSLVAVQFALPFAAPAAACCRADVDAAAAESGVDAEKDCCPAGSHPPGQCPLHRRASRQSESDCRIRCNAPHGAGFVTGVAGLLPPPPVARIEMVSSSLTGVAAPLVRSQFVPPVAPPPKVL